MVSASQSPQSDQELLNLVAKDDENAFAIIVDRYIDDVTRFAYYILGSYDSAQDIAQNVFIWLWVNRTSINQTVQLKPYLLKATRNKALDERKSESIRERHRVEIFSQHDRPGDSFPHAMPLATDRIQDAIDNLPERRRTAIRLRVEDGLSHKEIAEIMGVTPQAAQRLVSHALAQLRKLFNIRV